MGAWIRRRLAAEDGVALVVAIGTLSITMMLTGLTVAGAMQISGASNKDRSSKRAFAATEAGLQAAIYRLNNLAPSDGYCVTDAVRLPGTNGGCEWSEDMGRGVRVTYNMTPVLDVGKRCAGFPVTYDPGDPTETVAPRCITASASANGVRRRAQARVAMFKGTPIFPVGGILGLSGLLAKNNAHIAGAAASNGSVRFDNNAYVGKGVTVGPAGSLDTKGSFSTDGSPTLTNRTPDQGGFVLAPVEIGNSAAENDNGHWSFSNATYNWDATNRELTIDKGSLTLLGGTYNLCELTLKNKVDIFVAAGATVRLFIDSPERGSASGCREGTGNLTANNSLVFHNPNPPEALQIYVEGAGTVEFKNTLTLNGVLHAPKATVIFKNTANITGAVAADRVEFHNDLNFQWAPSVASLRGHTSALYYRTAWRECSPDPPSSADPSSGC